MGRPPQSYRYAGVDIERGNALVERIKPLAQGTVRAGVMGGVGGFGALVRLAGLGYRDPILVSSTDGVGTKQKLAIALDGHDTIGIDLVAMCANDVVVQGAEPLFFLDYFATGRLDVEVATRVIAGIAADCKQAGAALLAGRRRRCRTSTPRRTMTSPASASGWWRGRSPNPPLADPHLCAPDPRPHRPDTGPALAHITGGGLYENLPRVMPPDTRAVIDARVAPPAGLRLDPGPGCHRLARDAPHLQVRRRHGGGGRRARRGEGHRLAVPLGRPPGGSAPSCPSPRDTASAW
jgi:phosphoribosylformylglycinamidine cyclo-ligase